jgi:hypothetical protein
MVAMVWSINLLAKEKCYHTKNCHGCELRDGDLSCYGSMILLVDHFLASHDAILLMLHEFVITVKKSEASFLFASRPGVG